ncbi:MAG: L-lactate permease [Caldimicrobium sp.]|jgi:lactate permease|nr:L-lactate permease [Caldimicrobium sp.]
MDFILAILPIFVVLIGMVVFYRSGTFVAFVGWGLCVLFATTYFKTPLEVVLGATAIGFIKAFGITLAVIWTMFLIFLMRETSALRTLIEYVRGIAKDKIEQTLFLGMGFGSLSTSLGMVTPAMFPPIFRLLGFSAFSAIAISILCYDPLTSFALFSIPITLPAKVAFVDLGIKPPNILDLNQFIWDYTLKITLFLPVISVLFALLMLWSVGGKEALKKEFVPGVLSGLILSCTALILAYTQVLPVEVIGIAAGFATMLFVYLYYRTKKREDIPEERSRFDAKTFRALSPLLILVVLSAIVNIPSLKKFLSNCLGEWEVIPVFADKKEDLNILANVWFWIMIVSLLSILILKPTSEQFKNALKLWITRIWGPFFAYSLFFAVAFIMAWSGMEVVNGKLVPSPYFKQVNMNLIIATTLAKALGSAFPLAVPFVGLIGTFVGGSTTASNVLFAKIQWGVTNATLGAEAFMWVYAAHAVGGGIASAITPSKITNAAATIGVSGREEGRFIKAIIVPVVFMCLITGIMLYIFLNL